MSIQITTSHSYGCLLLAYVQVEVIAIALLLTPFVGVNFPASQ